MIGKILKLVLGSYNDRVLKKLWPSIAKINAFEKTVQGYSNIELQNKTQQFKDRYQKGESLESLLPEAFAVIREASSRILGLRHFDVQLLGGLVLHHGNISEMKTGEGKTLVATLPAYLHAITGKGVHIVTVNDYLAKRDSEWMGPLFQFMGLSVSSLHSDSSLEDRQEIYKADIVYGTTSEFGFDYLRDNMVLLAHKKVQKNHYYCIVDEVDSVLIDEARTPLIISGPSQDTTDKYYIANGVVRHLIPAVRKDDGKWDEESGDFIKEEKDNHISLTERGIGTAEKALSIDDIYQPEHLELVHAINQALKAHHLYHNGKEYLVENGEVVIVDENTGRKMEGRRYGDGLHQSIEAKEEVRIQRESQTLATVTIQNYFKMYQTLAGMTGTAETEAPEFLNIYNMDVIVIPTNKIIIRKDESDLIYKSKKAKYSALLEKIREIHTHQAPILIGTVAVEQSEEISSILIKEKIKHNVLNAKNHEREAEIISQAGALGSITIATNMAGRGTDIVLGGNPNFTIEKYLEKYIPTKDIKELSIQLFIRAAGNGNTQEAKTCLKENSEWQVLLKTEIIEHIQSIFEDWKKKQKEVIDAGGLHVVGTERHEARRIDNQLRGRSGRQGDPGFTRFYMSLEDHLFRIFGAEKMLPWLERAGFKDEDAIESKLITRMIENSQRKVEARNFDMRKHLLKYDEVMNSQRRIIYEIRDKILFNQNVKEEITFHIQEFVDSEVYHILGGKKQVFEQEKEQIILKLKQVFNVDVSKIDENFHKKPIQEVVEGLSFILRTEYDKKEQTIGSENLREAERTIMLQVIDDKWKDHLYNIDELREGINLRSYAEKNPLVEYQLESARIFEEMMLSLQEEILQAMFYLKVNHEFNFDEFMSSKEPVDMFLGDGESEPKEQPFKRTSKKIGRNAPCSCGSGKKYKNCHGKI